jgi:putative ABC transport system permease protein
LPGVLDVTANSAPPLAGRSNNLAISLDPSRPLASGSPTAERDIVLPNYFDVLKVRVLAGRGFTPADSAGAPRVALVSETMVRRFWSTTNPLGRQFRQPTGIVTVVGIVADVRNRALVDAAGATYYVPFAQEASRLTYLIRTRANPVALIEPASRAIWQAVPGSTVAEVASMDELRDRQLAEQRYRVLLGTIFSMMALVITAVGVAGLTARAAASRLKELCLRMALGETRAGAVLLTMQRAVGAVLFGMIAGLVITPIAAQRLSEYLFEVDAMDPATYLTVAAVMAACSVAVAALSARRLLGADLAMTLRRD